MNLPEKWNYMSNRCSSQRLEWDRIKRGFWLHYRLGQISCRSIDQSLGGVHTGCTTCTRFHFVAKCWCYLMSYLNHVILLLVVLVISVQAAKSVLFVGRHLKWLNVVEFLGLWSPSCCELRMLAFADKMCLFLIFLNTLMYTMSKIKTSLQTSLKISLVSASWSVTKGLRLQLLLEPGAENRLRLGWEGQEDRLRESDLGRIQVLVIPHNRITLSRVCSCMVFF